MWRYALLLPLVVGGCAFPFVPAESQIAESMVPVPINAVHNWAREKNGELRIDCSASREKLEPARVYKLEVVATISGTEIVLAGNARLLPKDVLGSQLTSGALVSGVSRAKYVVRDSLSRVVLGELDANTQAGVFGQPRTN